MTDVAGTSGSHARIRSSRRSAASWSRFCGVIPYALVALGLRLVMARVFFLSGQAKIEGPVIPVHLNVPG